MQIFDLACNKFVQDDLDTFKDSILGACHLLDDRFAMASRCELQFWKIVQKNDKCRLIPWECENAILLHASHPVVCVRLSAKSEFCAVGFSNGLIQLFRMDQRRPKLVHQLRSHTARIHTLIFSPWSSDTRKPVILASVSEQLCFWNVSFAVNNPTVDDQIDSYSDRFPDRSPVFPSLDYHQNIFEDDVEDGKLQSISPWIGKLGPMGKQELLACYKFNGNAAQQLFTNSDFTRFLTIDDVGEIYFLKVPNYDDSEAVSDSGIDEVIVELDTINMNDYNDDSDDL